MTGSPEHDPYENVVFIDEYPHLMRRREVRLALNGLTRVVNTDPTVILPFPEREEADGPDGAA